MTQPRLTVDLSAIAANWSALDRRSAPGIATGAAVKADAYGLGMGPVVRSLARLGVSTFFVATAEEGRVLRGHAGPGADIFVFSGYMPGDGQLMRDFALIPLINSAAQLRSFLGEQGGRPFGLQVNTGMNRLGMDETDMPATLSADPVLIMSHLASADQPENRQNRDQLKAFHEHRRRWPRIPASLAATGGILLDNGFHFDMTRPGIGLFGGLPFHDARAVVTLDLPVIQTRRIDPGQMVGYGGTWVARRPSRIATVAAGYADGLIRAMGNRGAVYADGTRCPIVGRVSMDLITVDVTELDHDPATVEILGPDQGIDDLAHAAGTIGYEILTSLGHRYERVYKGG